MALICNFTSQKERERLRNAKNENCTCKACKTIVFHRQICKFDMFLLPSSSWLRKLPNEKKLQCDIDWEMKDKTLISNKVIRIKFPPKKVPKMTSKRLDEGLTPASQFFLMVEIWSWFTCSVANFRVTLEMSAFKSVTVAHLRIIKERNFWFKCQVF